MKKTLRLSDILPAPEPRVNKRKRFIPVSSPEFGAEEIRKLNRCIRTGWVSSLGGYVKEFESSFAAACGTRYAVCCSSGTAALHLALAALRVGAGDEVIVPAFTMISTALAVRYQGAIPVFVDADPETGTIDAARLGEAVTARTRAVICVHMYGHPCDMDPIRRVCRTNGLKLVEDAAEAHGAEYKGKRAGGLSDIGCFSFYGNKIITTGEGGMLVTDNRRLRERAAYLCDMAFSPERHFWHREAAFNYRMSNLQAAVGAAQTARLERYIGKKRAIAEKYNRALAGIPGLALPVEKPYAKSVYWMYGVRVGDDFGCSRDTLRLKLAQQGIETRVFFVPMHLQPVFSGNRPRVGAFPVAEDLCRRGLYLPSGIALTNDEIGYIAETIRRAGR